MKLLRVLQEGEITPVGMDRPLRVKVRLVTATNRNLLEEIREGRFRKDLYPRLNKLQLKVPPQRERRQDIPLLAHHLAERFMGEPVEFSTEALTRLMMHSWPLNVRGLDGVVTQAVVDWSGQHGPVELSSVAVERMNELQDVAGPAKGTELTRERVEEVLRRTRGNMKKTAQELNLDRGYLYRVLKKMDLKADDYRNK